MRAHPSPTNSERGGKKRTGVRVSTLLRSLVGGLIEKRVRKSRAQVLRVA